MRQYAPFYLVLISLLVAVIIRPEHALAAVPQTPAQFVAHAGGEIKKLKYTNSLEALNESLSKNFNSFEIDLETTADGHIVLLHDWDYCMKHFFHVKPAMYTVEQFKKLTMVKGLTQLTFQELAVWLHEHPKTNVIIDTKRNTLRILKKINQEYPELKNRLIPQIYFFPQYTPVRQLGFNNIILTLYASNYHEQNVIEFAKKNNLWAVTMSVDKIKKSNLPLRLNKLGIFVYAHLVDSRAIAQELHQKKINGFYTASLAPTSTLYLSSSN